MVDTSACPSEFAGAAPTGDVAAAGLGALCPGRRRILAALPGVALLPVVLAACSSSTESSSPGSTGTSSGGGTAAAGGASGKHVTVAAASVPTGSAVVLADGATPYVVAQPTAGKFVAFSAICTHQGGTVTAGDGLTLVCPLHGSRFDAATGAVERGPATAPLPAVPVRDVNGTLQVG
ncbi:Rieske (2Fe-2S) protein [Tsukamurella soli]|uniref:Cytochrome bc1 complex Rieske iron-sulfur subunit n=1 Tax=Tsukamurella soli TaxID=644556 RepID=A0ABP8J4C0_9ACTN